MVLLNFFLHVAQYITFRKTNIVTATLIAESLLKSFYSMLGFKVIKDFATSPNFEEACKRFNYESGNYKTLKKKPLAYNIIKHSLDVLQFFMTIEYALLKIEMCSKIQMRFQHQIIGFCMNILMLKSRRK